MKLLLITDFSLDYTHFTLADEPRLLQYLSIQITHLMHHDLDQIRHYSSSQRYHLCLSISEAQFLDTNFHPQQWLNSVNNYKPNSSETTINRTTSYFNVFLDFDKCISISHIDHPIAPQRLHILSLHNHHLSTLWHSLNLKYYTLNYSQISHTDQTLNQMLIDLLIKIE